MDLRLLAISDTHVGEDSSRLSFPQGRQALWKTLRQTFGTPGAGPDNDAFTVDELVLIGDIPDRTLSSTAEIWTHTNALIQTLGSAAVVKRGVYVPGNHDHTLWTTYAQVRDHLPPPPPHPFGVTPPGGEPLIENGVPTDLGNTAGDEYLRILFGRPDGGSWRQIERSAGPDGFGFSVANPIYACTHNGRTYVFAHGTHFRKLDVAAAPVLKKLLDGLQLDRILGGIEVDTSEDVAKAEDLPDLERRAAGVTDTLWPSAGNDPTTKSDEVYYLYTALSGRRKHGRQTPPSTDLFTWSDLRLAPKARVLRLTAKGRPANDSVALWERLLLPHMLTYLKQHSLPTDELTFVYGDTHLGGWGEYTRDGGQPIRIYNTGGWTVDSPNNHPACHLFAVGTDGTEYLLDVALGKASVGAQALRDLASQTVQFRHRGTAKLLKFLLG